VSQLQPKIAMGMRKSDCDRILVQLFYWTEIDEAILVTQLPYRSEGGGSLASKKYKYVCFMFELFFAGVALDPIKNITNNPTCEWQLRLYSKRHTSDSSYMMYINITQVAVHVVCATRHIQALTNGY
jgi:hypothetical protein